MGEGKRSRARRFFVALIDWRFGWRFAFDGLDARLTFSEPPPKRDFSKAQVAELVDALASGASVLMDVEVRVFSWAP